MLIVAFQVSAWPRWERDRPECSDRHGDIYPIRGEYHPQPVWSLFSPSWCRFGPPQKDFRSSGTTSPNQNIVLIELHSNEGRAARRHWRPAACVCGRSHHLERGTAREARDGSRRTPRRSFRRTRENESRSAPASNHTGFLLVVMEEASCSGHQQPGR